MKWNLEYMSTWLVLTHIFLGYHSGMQSYSPCMGFRSFQMFPQSWVLALLLLALAFQGTFLTTWGIKHQPLPGLPMWKVYPYGRSTCMEGLPIWKVCQQTHSPCSAEGMWIASFPFLELSPGPSTPYLSMAKRGWASWGPSLPSPPPWLQPWAH